MNREQIEQEVARLADAWAAAELQRDTAFLEKLLADDFVGVGPLGFLLSRQEWLARHQSGDMKYDVHSLDEVRVRAYNEAAIVIGRLTKASGLSGQSHERADAHHAGVCPPTRAMATGRSPLLSYWPAPAFRATLSRPRPAAHVVAGPAGVPTRRQETTV